ncbi:MAG: NUDIX domain-containing protein [Candidatus Paceibacterota bacterium]
MKNIFSGAKEYPFHLSIGALLVNDIGEICCHFYPEGLPYESGNEGELYLLMRETPHEGESIEDVVHRGIYEEFGAKGKITHYLGTVNSWFPGVTTGITIHKTTLYFLTKLDHIDLSKRDYDDVESTSTIMWIEPEELKDIFIKQGKRFKRTDLDESKIVENYIKHARN